MTTSTREAQALEAIRGVVLGCREWIDKKRDCCWAPAEYVLWGKLIPPEGLGPRCYEHALEHIDHYDLGPGTSYALVHLGDLARAVASSLAQEGSG